MKKVYLLLTCSLLTVSALAGCKHKGKNSNSNDKSSVNYQVNEEQFENCFSKIESTPNYTLNYCMDISFNLNGSTFKELLSSSTKFDDKRVSYDYTNTDIDVYTKKDLEDEAKDIASDDSPEALEEALKSVIASIEEEATRIERTEDGGLIAYVDDKYMTEYAELSDNPLFAYSYCFADDFGTGYYYKSLMFLEDVEAFCQVFDFKEMLDDILKLDFNSFTYNEAKHIYYIDGISELIEDLSGDDEIPSIVATLSFEDELLRSFVIDASDDNNQIKLEYSIDDVGTSKVTTPSKIKTCDHESVSSITSEYNDFYHYSICDECNEVISYHSHDFEHGVCRICGCYAKSDHDSDIVLDDPAFKGHAHFYNEYDKDGNLLRISTKSSYYYISSFYMGCSEHDACELFYHREEELSDVENEPCLKKKTVTYNVYKGTVEEPILVTTLTYDEYEVHHDELIEETPDVSNPCKSHVHIECKNCDYCEDYVEVYHNYKTTYSQSNCVLTKIETCEDCGKQNTYSRESHTGFVAESYDHKTNVLCGHCSDCDKDTKLNFYNLSLNYSKSYHQGTIENDDGVTIAHYETIPHFYKDDVCLICGQHKEESDVEFLYWANEGLDYLYIQYNINNKQPQSVSYPYNWIGFTEEDGTYGYRSPISDWVVYCKSEYNPSVGRTIYSYKIYSGSTLVREFEA